MATDPSIPLNANRPTFNQPNMLAQYSDIAKTGNALIQGRQLQMQMAGRQALQQAYQGVAIDPQTGLPDGKALIANLQRTPGGGLVLPDVIKSIQEQQQRQYDLNKASLGQTTARTNAVNGALAPLMRMGANVTPQDIFTQIAGLHAAGMPTDEFVQDAATTLPNRQPGQSPAQYGQQLQAWVVNHAARTWDPATQAVQFTPKVTMVDNGGQIVPTDTNPLTNPGLVGGPAIRRTFTPAEQATQVKGPVGPNGAPTVIPQSTYAQGAGLGNLVPGGAAGGAPGQPSPLGTGRPGGVPPALLNPNRPGGAQPASAQQGGYAPMAPPSAPPAQGAPASAAPQMPPPGQPMATGLGPAQQAGLDAAGHASAAQLAALQQSVGGSGARIYQLQSAAKELAALGQTGTGPSAGALNTAKSYLQSLPIIGQSLGIDPTQVADYDMANKYLTAYASARANARGGSTDAQLATTLSGNASTHISNLAAQDVVKANLGLERMDQAQLASFQRGLDPATGQPTGKQMTPDQFGTYSAQWNSTQDPRAYVADQLSAPQFAATVNSMQPAERTRFQNTFNSAIQNGFMDPPAWMQQSSAPPATATPAASTSAAASPAPSPTAVPPAAIVAPATATQPDFSRGY